MLTELFKRARRAATPIIGVRTQNWQGTFRKLARVERKGSPDPAVIWDFIQGVLPINEKGRSEIVPLFIEEGDDVTVGNPVMFLSKLSALEIPAVCFFVLPKDVFNDNPDGAILQGISNLRDPFKATGACLVILSADISLPTFLQQDVSVLEDTLPDNDTLLGIVQQAFSDFKINLPDNDTLLKAVDSIRGLSTFAAEQAVFMSMSKKGLDLDTLWSQKRELIAQTPGLSVQPNIGMFDDVSGCKSIKDFIGQIFSGKKPPRAIIWLDEIEKAIQGYAGDVSGTSADQLGVLLTQMQKHNYPAIMCLGFPGTGKSFIAQTAGPTFDVPTIQFDMGGMKGSGLVGQAEKGIRRGFEIVEAISGGNALFIATSNNIATLPPELRRRFNFGTYFFDLPDEEGLKSLWDYYTGKYGLSKEDIPACPGWTGAEVRNVCEIAWRTGQPLREAVTRITPIVQTMPEVIRKLRKEAQGRYQDADKLGVYEINTNAQSSRRIETWWARTEEER